MSITYISIFTSPVYEAHVLLHSAYLDVIGCSVLHVGGAALHQDVSVLAVGVADQPWHAGFIGNVGVEAAVAGQG